MLFYVKELISFIFYDEIFVENVIHTLVFSVKEHKIIADFTFLYKSEIIC